MLNFSNFVRTTLRTPVTPADTMLLLEAGSAALFAIPAGDYMYVTVNDGVTVEVMKYTSIGPVINDTVPVTRGEDGTTAKAFPAGACVQVAWNKAQVAEFVTQLYNDMFNAALLGADTIQVTATPTATPPGGVFYAVKVDTHQMWYWNVNGPGWIELGNISQGIIVVTSPPATAPPANVRFAVNTSTSSLYYWNNTAWIQMSNAASQTGHEIWSRGTTSTSTIPVNTVRTGRDFTWADHHRWVENPAQGTILTIDQFQRFQVLHDALVQVSCGLSGAAVTPGVDCKGTFVLTTDDPALPTGEWGVAWNFDPQQSQSAVVASSITTPILLHSGRVIDVNVIVDQFSVSGIRVDKILIAMEVIALQ